MTSPAKRVAALAGLLASLATAQAPALNAITAVRHWTLGEVTRIVVETTAEFEFRRDRVPNPDRIFFDLPDTRVRLGKKGMLTYPVHDGRLKQIRVAETTPGTSRVVFDLQEGVEYSASMLSNPPRLIVELKPSITALAKLPKPVPEPVLTGPEPGLPRATATPAPSGPVAGIQTAVVTGPPPPVQRPRTQEAVMTAVTTPPAARTKSPPPKAAKLGTSQSMTRVLGLKVGRIVLDAGHGGHDTGTAGRGGLLEKDLVLDVTRRLGELIETKLGAEVVYTRGDDTFIPLERRTEVANDSKADLFLSIHANSSPSSSSSGVETYYLNFSTSREAMEVAARENASSQKTVYELKDLVQKIAMQDKVDESRQFAARVQQSVYATAAKANVRTRDRGVRKAPFVVLIGASMPSVLAEIGFISNPRDEALFRRPEFRQKIAEGLYLGISRYASTLSQFQFAARN